ncbi:LolA family protein [Streptomyces sp. STR69]|uniref:LolA family protein n=1 Tax=Streptomyces sp. STR69 TaxID=1796942 RepID=UPI0021C5A8A5|nr:outer-membrane lipoprotein carrier protein LolA [Streptomyces sp. STR69]
MAPYETDDSTDTGEADELRSGRRRAARYIVPVTVVGVAAATIGLVPALADSGDPNLPKITAQQLLDKVAKSDVQQLSGTVKISTDLGLPDLGGLESSMLSGATKSGDGSSADPTGKLTELATGSHTLRVAADGPDKQKVSLLENAAEYSLIHNGKDVWGYDSQSNEVYHATTSADASKSDETKATPKGLTDEALKSVDDTTSVTVDGTEHVAGRDAYKLLIKPKQSGTTVGTISIAVDAKTGLPLKFTLTPASGGAAVVDVGFTQLSLAKPAASTFDFKVPKGAKVTTEDSPAKATPDHSAPFGKNDKPGKADKGLGKSTDDPTVIGKGWNSIAVFETGGQGIPSGGSSSGGGDLGGFLSSLGDQVKGSFGSGTVYSTRLINALVTDDGKVYVGAVTKSALVKAADAAK